MCQGRLDPGKQDSFLQWQLAVDLGFIIVMKYHHNNDHELLITQEWRSQYLVRIVSVHPGCSHPPSEAQLAEESLGHHVVILNVDTGNQPPPCSLLQ